MFLGAAALPAALIRTMVLLKTLDDGMRPTTAPGTAGSFLTEVDAAPGAHSPRPDTAPHPSHAPAPSDDITPPPEVEVGEVAQKLFPLLAPKTGLAGKVGLLKLQGAIGTVKDKRRK